MVTGPQTTGLPLRTPGLGASYVPATCLALTGPGTEGALVPVTANPSWKGGLTATCHSKSQLVAISRLDFDP